MDLKGDILGLGKVWQNLYVCGIGLFSYLPYVHFFKFHAEQYRKAETVQSNTVGYYPSSKLPFHGIQNVLTVVYMSLAVLGFTL